MVKIVLFKTNPFCNGFGAVISPKIFQNFNLCASTS